MPERQGDLPRLIALFGSGETSPVMTSVHQELIARVSHPDLNAILIDTPFGFQENADEIAFRIVAYFRQNVGSEITVASLRHSGRATALEVEQFLKSISDANYVFAGPGSPTYTVAHLRNHGVRDQLVNIVGRGGCLAFASAAAIGLGAYALPVYEIYKVGDDPSWTEGLDVLGEIGIRCAVIPHYNNREGGSHDTRFCYMGESRLRVLESMLPDDVLILGIDEYTACIIDIDAQTVTVRGPGGVTVRRRGLERRWERTSFPFPELMGAVSTPSPLAGEARGAASTPSPLAGEARGGGSIGEDSPMLEQTRAWGASGRDAISRRDVDGLVTVILEMESMLHEWGSDLGGTNERDRGRAELRQLVVRLGEMVRGGTQAGMREHLEPLVDVLLSLRGEARREQRFQEADRLRDILAQVGVEVEDTAAGTGWSLAHR
jgi:cyanophycinase-like exopeptidase